VSLIKLQTYHRQVLFTHLYQIQIEWIKFLEEGLYLQLYWGLSWDYHRGLQIISWTQKKLQREHLTQILLFLILVIPVRKSTFFLFNPSIFLDLLKDRPTSFYEYTDNLSFLCLYKSYFQWRNEITYTAKLTLEKKGKIRKTGLLVLNQLSKIFKKSYCYF